VNRQRRLAQLIGSAALLFAQGCARDVAAVAVAASPTTPVATHAAPAPPVPTEVEIVVRAPATKEQIHRAPDAPRQPPFEAEEIDLSAYSLPKGPVQGGVPGPRATGLRPAPSGTSARLKGKFGDCPFPSDADAAGVDEARVTLVVGVDLTGRPTHVKILEDPGHGFGRAARDCMMQRTYTPALDQAGAPVGGDTGSIVFRFVR
jgi:hypothetical protein